LRLIQLDEYLGLGEDDPRSLLGWLLRDVARPLRVEDGDVVRLRGDAPDPDAACRAYDAEVGAAGGVDVAVLGLGPNGHLGFNEPPSPRDAPTRVVALAAESLVSNARYWPGQACPPAALTAGMSTILGARRIVLVVAGAHKCSILARLLTEPVGPGLPASFLREHPAATLLADEAAWPEALPA
jgi:glucosamine-6-phosphate deaminase